MDDVKQLTDELSGVLDGMTQTEVALADLHASIYKCREEARKVRRSAPPKEFVDGVRERVASGMTDVEAQRCAGVLRDKLRKARAAAKKMREHVQCQFQKKPQARWQPKWLILLFLLLAAVLVGGGFYYHYYYRRSLDSMSTSTKSE